MFKERGQQVSQYIHDRSMDAVDKIAGTHTAKKVLRKTSGFLIERGQDLFSYQGLGDALLETRLYLEEGQKLVILSSHKSHGEIAPAVHIMEKFMEFNPDLLTDFAVPVAASMAGGQQGNIIKTLYEDALVPNTGSRNIKTIPVVTDSDVKNREMKQSKLSNGKAILEPLRSPNTGFFIFIEGTVKGGRKNPETEDIYGLQEPDSMLTQLLDYSKKSGTRLVFLTLGMSNTHHLLSADGKFFTPEWVSAMAGNHFSQDKKYAVANLSGPISTESLNLENIDQACENLMISLASCLPENERGMYKGVEYLLST